VSNLIYNNDYKAIAKETGSQFVPHILDNTLGNQALMSDQIHPNDAGYKIFAVEIEPSLRDVL
jgi:lysophospholipase L1-like esterase